MEISSPARRLQALALVAPALLLVGMGWHHRWVADDGFINVRVIHQIVAGNGPVFNAGERVEAATSTVWVWLVAAFHALGAPAEWVMVVAGLAFAAAAMVMAASSSVALGQRRDGAVLVPFGAMAYAALLPAWDFVTSGMEMSLVIAWLAACHWALVRRRAALAAGEELPLWKPVWLPVLIGLAPLIRPDLAIMAVPSALALAVVSRCTWRGALAAASLAAAAPAAWQLFRMGYFAAVVPNTALAKSASEALWERGLAYLVDLVVSYVLVVPVVVVAFVHRSWWMRNPGWAARAVTLAPVAAGVLHGAYVVRVGGDFMHGRLLLPAAFAVLALSPAVSVDRRGLRRVGVAVAGAWLVLAAVALRPRFTGEEKSGVIINERSYYVEVAEDPNPVMADSYPEWLVARGDEVERRAADGEDVLVTFGGENPHLVPLPEGSGALLAVNILGIPSVSAGTEIEVVDLLSLAHPVGSRMSVTGGRPGHEKPLPGVWSRGLHGAEGSGERAVAAAAGCGELAELLDAVGAPLTRERFVSNVRSSLSFTAMKVPRDPEEARRTFCGPSGAPDRR